jgi:hypothetical protein
MQVLNKWAHVTLNQYYDLLDVIDLPLSDEDKAIAMLSALSGMPIETLTDEIDVKTLAKSINDLKFIGEHKTEGKAKAYFKCGKKKFYFDMVLRDSNASSFISLSEQLKDPIKSKKNIHNVIAIFCHELNWWGFKKKRTVNTQKEIAEHLKNNMNMNDAFLYRDFFLHSFKVLSKATLNYLDKQNKKILKDLKKEISNLHS